MKLFTSIRKKRNVFQIFHNLIAMIQMENQDLELAKQKLIKEDLSLVIVKNQKVVFDTKKRGINAFLQAIETLKQDFIDSSIADKIVGVAAAMLCVYCGVSAVYAQTISEAGIRVLENHNIVYNFEKNVSNILNRNRTGVCPFEKIAISSKNPMEAYEKLKDLSTQIVTKSN
jgi:UDP-3-O-acyl-N-acetylglucosamine deacetylase